MPASPAPEPDPPAERGSDHGPDQIVDCGPPEPAATPAQVYAQIKKRVRQQRGQRAVVNLHQWDQDVDSLRRQFSNTPVDGLREVKAVTRDGQVIMLWRREGQVAQDGRGQKVT